jgi:hypothetical protein
MGYIRFSPLPAEESETGEICASHIYPAVADMDNPGIVRSLRPDIKFHGSSDKRHNRQRLRVVKIELSKDEKETIKFILQKHLEEYKKEEVKRDVPLKFLQAEEDYEEWLEKLIKKF